MKNNYKIIDLLKFFFAICVVGIHTGIASNFDNNFQWYIYSMVFMLAVPFFFMTSGFFYGKKVNNSNDLNTITKASTKRLLIPFIFWIIVGLPYTFISFLSEKSFIETVILIIRNLIFYPWGALWYVLATIVAIIILKKFIETKKVKEALIIGIILFGFCLLEDTYFFLLKGSIFEKLIYIYRKLFVSARNGLFAGFPLFTIGYYISIKESKIEKIEIKKIVLFSVLFTIFGLFEVSSIRFLSSHYSFLISTIPLSSMLLIICIKLKNINISINTKIFRNMSTSIYFMHANIIHYLSLFGLTLLSYQTFLVVILIVFSLILLLYKINNKYINMVIK